MIGNTIDERVGAPHRAFRKHGYPSLRPRGIANESTEGKSTLLEDVGRATAFATVIDGPRTRYVRTDSAFWEVVRE